MKPCDHLSPYLDGRLERAGRDYFESHLHICSDCRDVVNVWMCTKNGLRNEANARRRHLTPTDEEAAKLVEWAILEQSSKGWGSIKVWVPVTALVSFVLAFWLGSIWTPVQDTPPAQLTHNVATMDAEEEVASLQAPLQATYESTEEGHSVFRLGKDRFGLAPTSQLSVVPSLPNETVLNLEEGFGVFQVSPRKSGRRFIVQAGAYRVLVVGTRFSVDRTGKGVRVSVVEGIVQVSEEGGREWRLTAGEALAVAKGEEAVVSKGKLEDTLAMAQFLGEMPMKSKETAAEDAVAMQFELEDEAPIRRKRFKRRRAAWKRAAKVEPSIYLEETPQEPVAAVNSDSVNETPQQPKVAPVQKGVNLWRQWVLDGKLRAAEAALVDHVANNPVDTDAYSLLADCRRKAGKYREAIETYRRLTAIAPENQANRARFKAGVLMQENLKNHLGAAAIFDEYLKTKKGTPLLRATATVRLAKSLIELGETVRAKTLLRRIITGYGGSSVAIQAREILNDID